MKRPCLLTSSACVRPRRHTCWVPGTQVFRRSTVRVIVVGSQVRNSCNRIYVGWSHEVDYISPTRSFPKALGDVYRFSMILLLCFGGRCHVATSEITLLWNIQCVMCLRNWLEIARQNISESLTCHIIYVHYIVHIFILNSFIYSLSSKAIFIQPPPAAGLRHSDNSVLPFRRSNSLKTFITKLTIAT